MRHNPGLATLAIVLSVSFMNCRAYAQGSKLLPPQTVDQYDFRAGEKIIFEDDLISEMAGEFPSRWELQSGNAQAAVVLETCWV